jgi:hypothetical protein
MLIEKLYLKQEAMHGKITLKGVQVIAVNVSI